MAELVGRVLELLRSIDSLCMADGGGGLLMLVLDVSVRRGINLQGSYGWRVVKALVRCFSRMLIQIAWQIGRRVA